jgi:aspartate-semialdehyde dehydrogenase
MDPAVPLVVPEVNGDDLDWHDGIVSIPNCSTTPLVMAVHPLRQASAIRRIVADTYQSVSGAGGAAMNELRDQTRAVMHGGPAEPDAQPQQIAFNVIPQIDSFNASGYTREEQKMIDESRKILHEPEMAVSATCVRVPVYLALCRSPFGICGTGVSRRGPGVAEPDAGRCRTGRSHGFRLSHAGGRCGM